jgi:hypothetical protein
MVEAYNFLGSWQLFPEKGSYEFSARPRSGIYRIDFGEAKKELKISMNWVTLEDHAFHSAYTVVPDGEEHPVEHIDIADTIRTVFTETTSFENHFFRSGMEILRVAHEITPKGYLKVTHRSILPDGNIETNTEIYHRQLSVLPYSASVSGALIKPNEEGVIRHHALTAMEEQTNMQLTQIRQQIELLAIQAKEIQHRKELSMLIYDARLSFNPVIGQVYYLYEKDDSSHLLSLVGPKEWGKKIPFKSFVAAVKLLADHTWTEV